MSLIKSFKPIQLELGYSRILLSCGVFIHGVAVTAMLTLISAHPVFVLSLPLIVVHFRHYCRQHVNLSSGQAVVALKWHGTPVWQLGLHDGSEIKVQLCEPVFVTSFLIILAFKHEPQMLRRVVLLTRDRTERAAYHALQVRLITSTAESLSGNM